LQAIVVFVEFSIREFKNEVSFGGRDREISSFLNPQPEAVRSLNVKELCERGEKTGHWIRAERDIRNIQVKEQTQERKW
jgi:hypothetical protein